MPALYCVGFITIVQLARGGRAAEEEYMEIGYCLNWDIWLQSVQLAAKSTNRVMIIESLLIDVHSSALLDGHKIQINNSSEVLVVYFVPLCLEFC
jgi:uncharacterized membrane protein